MNIFCIDIGNTRTHCGTVTGGRVADATHIPTALLRDHAAPPEPIRAGVAGADGIAYCSVVPAAGENLEAAFRASPAPVFHLTHKSCRGLDLVYPNPGEIGEDRIANALAAQAGYALPVVVIDMGTAVTFDVVTAKGYEGGIIAPGLELMTRYLHEQTALLPELAEADLAGIEGAIGKSTVDAMRLGVVVGFSGMLDALLARVSRELRERGTGTPEVISTGGDLGALLSEWRDRTRFVPDLTLQGLAVGFERRDTA